jgi:putative ABC transport system permease protein
VIAAIDEIEKRVRALPGVTSVGASSTLALRGFLWSGDATVEGRGGNDYERELRHESVTPEYFRAIGAPLVRGRFLDARDRPPNPTVTLVNEALATKYFRGADPVGKRIKFGRPTDSEANAPWVTIVGIVADQKQDGLDAPVQPEAYEPFQQNTQNDMTFAVRTPLDTEAVVAGVRSAVRSFDKDLALVDVMTLDHVVTASTGDQRFRTWLLAGFAGIALFLAGLGIYGVLAYFVTQRARELGIRLALGASPGRLFQMVIRQGMAPVAAGAAAGLAGAYAATGLMRSLLYGVQPLDPATYALTAAILAAVALIACAVPAARATRVDPLIALREE